MLGKLLKHEFRATGRLMLPALGAVIVLAVLANLSIRALQTVGSSFLSMLLGLVVAAFVIGMIAVAVMTTVLMILRFYRNLLKDEGYLMHTLPVSVHGLVWSKLIVSLVWFIVTFLVIAVVLFLTVLLQSGTDLSQFFVYFPSWAEIQEGMAQVGIRMSDLWVLGIELLVSILLAMLGTCLHFYAAMSLGQIFAKDKVLLSVLFFIGLSIAMSILSTGVGFPLIFNAANVGNLETFRAGMLVMRQIMVRGVLMGLVQGAILYVITIFCLQKKLNLG